MTRREVSAIRILLGQRVTRTFWDGEPSWHANVSPLKENSVREKEKGAALPLGLTP